jgi:hypothetical protein
MAGRIDYYHDPDAPPANSIVVAVTAFIRLFAVSSGLLRVRWGQGMYAGLGWVRVGRGSLAAVR